MLVLDLYLNLTNISSFFAAFPAMRQIFYLYSSPLPCLSETKYEQTLFCTLPLQWHGQMETWQYNKRLITVIFIPNTPPDETRPLV